MAIMLDRDIIRNAYGPLALYKNKIPFAYQDKIFIAYIKILGK